MTGVLAGYFFLHKSDKELRLSEVFFFVNNPSHCMVRENGPEGLRSDHSPLEFDPFIVHSEQDS